MYCYYIIIHNQYHMRNIISSAISYEMKNWEPNTIISFVRIFVPNVLMKAKATINNVCKTVLEQFCWKAPAYIFVRISTYNTAVNRSHSFLPISPTKRRHFDVFISNRSILFARRYIGLRSSIYLRCFTISQLMEFNAKMFVCNYAFAILNR